ncbi:MAG: site-specific integrase [Campylobacterales bacterium]|nr:site-specific integrase [Campylobacterales bacterium]
MARKKANQFREEIAKGIDPLEVKAEIKEQLTHDDKSQFHKVVYQWIDEIIAKNNTTTTINRIRRTFERDVFPYLCSYNQDHHIVSSPPISEISHSDILKIVKEKSLTTAETAKRILSNCNRIWIFAISHEYCEYNVIANISAKDSLPRIQKKHYPKITDTKILGELLHDMDNYKGNKIIRLALQLLPYVMLRAENLCTLRWKYVDFKKRLLTIPRELMKVKDKNLDDFVLPLTNKALEILQETHQLTSWSPLVFHSVTDIHKPINPTSINKALKIMGYNDERSGKKQTIHSFRGTFRSLIETHANEHKASFEVKESILDHHSGSMVERAYTHKADYTKQARELLEWWEEFLERVKNNPHYS